MMKKQSELEQIPGVGKAIAEDLNHLGIHQVQELRNQDPEILYRQLCDYEGKPVDRCMLYALCCMCCDVRSTMLPLKTLTPNC